MSKKFFFESLVEEIQNQWELERFSLAQFPAIATKALQNLEYPIGLKELEQELTRWFLSSQSLPEQIHVHNTFGQPPITLFNNGQFLIEIYIWVNYDTAIHSHGFRGAFRVLHGKSLQENFNPQLVQQWSEDVKLTKLGNPEVQLLFPGDITTIYPDEKLIHRLIHLENPTVTLCVKTINEKNLPQWSFFPNGLAIQKRQISSELIKQIYYTQYLLERDEAQAISFFSQIIEKLKPSLQLNLAEEILSGGIDLQQEVAVHLFDFILEKNQETGWYELFTALPQLNMGEFNFDHFDTPEARILSHFINCGYSKKMAILYLAKLNMAENSTVNLTPLLQQIFTDERTYGQEVSAQQLRAFQEAILNPERSIPSGLRKDPQFSKLKKFLNG